jgi:hypothetical protein
MLYARKTGRALLERTLLKTRTNDLVCEHCKDKGRNTKAAQQRAEPQRATHPFFGRRAFPSKGFLHTAISISPTDYPGLDRQFSRMPHLVLDIPSRAGPAFTKAAPAFAEAGPAFVKAGPALAK